MLAPDQMLRILPITLAPLKAWIPKKSKMK